MVNIAQILMVCFGVIQFHFKNDDIYGSVHISKNSIHV
jgi:hypothetical protein